MRKLLAIAALVALAVMVKAGTSQFVGSLSTLDNTTNDTPGTAFGTFVCFPASSFAITNSGLTATNALTDLGQFSLDNTNWTTVVTFNPATTNATNEVWRPASTARQGYWRLRVVTTNSVGLSIVGQY